jgi:hypothetical protein
MASGAKALFLLVGFLAGLKPRPSGSNLHEVCFFVGPIRRPTSAAEAARCCKHFRHGQRRALTNGKGSRLFSSRLIVEFQRKKKIPPAFAIILLRRGEALRSG